jgi:predicted ABC-type ATPase
VNRASPPELWLVAGINGAGKSTFASRARGDCLNPDKLARSIARWARVPILANWMAVEYIEWRVARAISRGESIAVETVLSSNKYMKHVRRARERGFRVAMVYVTLSSVELSLGRVATRVSAGGHDVPEAKIRDRWTRSLDNLAAFAPLVDQLEVFDNSDTQPVLVAYKNSPGRVVVLRPAQVPEVARRF